MLQEKIVRYLDYKEQGKGKRCVGYLRGELYEATCNIEICVQKMHETDSFGREVIMHGFDENDNPVEFSMGEVLLSHGQASVCFQGVDRNNLMGSGMPWEQLWEICIPIGAGSEIECEIHKNLHGIIREDNRTVKEDKKILVENFRNFEGGNEKQEQEEKGHSSEQIQVQEQVLEAAQIKEKEPEEPIRIPRMQEEKWAQLSVIYPKVNPFKDQRTYLKLGIQDFVLLPEKYYAMCKNSFLLHGYMNYGYLVLGMFVKRGNYEYYLGVPGVFFEKERQVAKLYGFDYFEADRELARDGDFGIYLMKIAL